MALTSGTLSNNNSFDHIKDKLGITNCEEFISNKGLTSPESVGFYIGKDLPDPRRDEVEDNVFTKACAERIAELIKCSGGRALVLFTSHRRLNEVYKIINNRRDIPWRVIHQRQKSAAQIFREDKTSVLMATGSYWEGFDVMGDSLTMVIMDKLPFPSPMSAYTAAKHKELAEQGMTEYEIRENLYIPEMLLQLKQGAGRLLRHEDDWGVIAILDPRADNNKYRDIVTNCIPPHIKLNSVQDIATWFDDRIVVNH